MDNKQQENVSDLFYDHIYYFGAVQSLRILWVGLLIAVFHSLDARSGICFLGAVTG